MTKKSKMRLLTFSTAIAISLLCGCDDYKDPEIKLVEWNKGRFLNHVLVDKRDLKFRATTFDYDLKKLDGHYCSPAKVTAENLSWARRQLRQVQDVFLLDR